MVGPPRGDRTPMTQPVSLRPIPRTQLAAAQALAAVRRFMHIEAVSGVVLLAAAAIALIWANSPWASSYHAFWHLPVSVGLGHIFISKSLHFLINDGLMTIFFLVVGMEIRREIHEGALSRLHEAALPLAAAAGGVIVPALMYLAMNGDAVRGQGWAVPTATDIAFAVGVLALLGRSIPGSIRIFLLALAIIDDVIAIMIIALFYSSGLDLSGFLVAGFGIFMVLGFQRIGVGSAWAYALPGAVVWIGLLMTGAHPTLSGVILGFLTPVLPMPTRNLPTESIWQILQDLRSGGGIAGHDAHHLASSVREIRLAQREILPPVSRVQIALHPWVAYGIMPVFALANAGVTVGGIDLGAGDALWVMLGVSIALVIGKPVGILAASYLTVRVGLCRLPHGVTWSGLLLAGLLAGIGFTMSIFIAMLAFADPNLLAAAKLGVLLASLVAAVLGLSWGVWYSRRRVSAGDP
jgi:NhaA family Na+:H+ antiporter